MKDVKTILNKLNFIEKANLKFGNKFDYSLVEYKNIYTPVTIKCPDHGEFEQRPEKHLESKHGCAKCAVITKDSLKDSFINKCNIKFKNKFDYSLVEYVNGRVDVTVVCPVHGDFKQKPEKHLSSTFGCYMCYLDNISTISIIRQEKPKSNTHEFIQKAKLIHAEKFDYSLVDYTNAKQKVKIKCNTCQTVFEQKANGHLNGKGCLVCAQNKQRTNSILKKSVEKFILEAKLIHGDFYDYSNVTYKNSDTNIRIICPEHGEFVQKPNNHLDGAGCQTCGSFTNVSELRLYNKLKQIFNNERVIHQAKPEWLKFHNGQQSFDIYFPKYNMAIEYQGIQHFRSVAFFGGDKKFRENQLRDDRKRKLCLCNSCKLFYFTYDKKDIPKDYNYKVYHKEDDLIVDIELEIAKTFQ